MSSEYYSDYDPEMQDLQADLDPKDPLHLDRGMRRLQYDLDPEDRLHPAYGITHGLFSPTLPPQRQPGIQSILPRPHVAPSSQEAVFEGFRQQTQAEHNQQRNIMNADRLPDLVGEQWEEDTDAMEEQYEDDRQAMANAPYNWEKKMRKLEDMEAMEEQYEDDRQAMANAPYNWGLKRRRR
jgi:hypothetical protein